MKTVNKLSLRNLSASLITTTILSLGLCLGAATASAEPEMLQYNFDDGTFQGWTPVIPYNQLEWAVNSNTNGSRRSAQSGSFRILPEDHNSRNIVHDTLWLRSPVFQLSDHAALTFYMMGGSSPALPDNAADVSLSSSSSGYMGLALRRVSDGAFVLKYTLPSNNDSTWTLGQWTEAQLSPFANDYFTLDLIDQRDGGWAFLHLDTVSIGVVPEPASAALLFGGLVSGLVLLKRRRR